MGLLISSSRSAVSRGWPFSGLGPKSRNASFLRLLRLGRGVFRGQDVASKSLRKVLVSKRKMLNSFSGSMSRSIFGSGRVFLRCGARFGALRRRGECHFGPLHAVSGPHCAVVLPAAPCVCGLRNPLSLRFGEVFVRHLATRGVLVLAAEPCVVTAEFRLWLRFRGVLRGLFATCGLCDLIGPKTPRNCGNKRFWLERMLSLWTSETLPKNKWRVDHNIRFLRVELYDLRRFRGLHFLFWYVLLFLSLVFCCSVAVIFFSCGCCCGFFLVLCCCCWLLLVVVVGCWLLVVGCWLLVVVVVVVVVVVIVVVVVVVM